MTLNHCAKIPRQLRQDYHHEEPVKQATTDQEQRARTIKRHHIRGSAQTVKNCKGDMKSGGSCLQCESEDACPYQAKHGDVSTESMTLYESITLNKVLGSARSAQ